MKEMVKSSPCLLNQINAGLEIHSEVDELPLDALLFVLFLFQDEHVVVEELLQTLVRVVDAQLLKRVELQEKSRTLILLLIK